MEKIYCLTIKVSDLRMFCQKNQSYILVEEYDPQKDCAIVELRTESYHKRRNTFYNGIGPNQYNRGIRKYDADEVKFFFKNNLFVIQNCLPDNFEFCDFFVYYQIPFIFSVEDLQDCYVYRNHKLHQLCAYF